MKLLTARRRRGVASVIGTVIFVVVFMLALGATVYISGLQVELSQAQRAAVGEAALHASEDLALGIGPSGLAAFNRGTHTAEVNHVVLKYPNGTAFALAASAVISSGGEAQVASLIPPGDCTPGRATCVSRFAQILAGNPPGSSVGLVTSLGNAFWNTYGEGQVDWSSVTGFPPPCAAGEGVTQLKTAPVCSPLGATAHLLRAPVVTRGEGNFTSTGLVVPLANDTAYVFYAFTSVSPSMGVEGYEFEIRDLPPGADLLIACAPMAYPLGGGNQATECTDSAGTPVDHPLTFGVRPPVFETPGVFGSVVVGSTPGYLEIDFACVSNCGSVSMNAGSFVVAQPAS